MYGFEKDKKKKSAFDLENEILARPEYGKELHEKAEKRIQEVKKLLREGAHEKDFDRLGILLHGYSALQKVIKKVGASK